MSQPEHIQLPLPLFLCAVLVAARLQRQVLQVPVPTVVDAINQRPDLFHYRALRDGTLLMWDIRPEAYDALREHVPDLVAAAQQEGITSTPPFHAFEQPNTPPAQMWKQRQEQLKAQGQWGDIVDTTKPQCEPIFGQDSEFSVQFMSEDDALDMLNEALDMTPGPLRDAAIERAKDILRSLQTHV